MSAKSFGVVARLKAESGKETELKNILQDLISPSRDELGCLSYELLVNKDDLKEFTFVEQWADDSAFNGHLKTPHIKNAIQKFPEVLDREMDLRKYDNIS